VTESSRAENALRDLTRTALQDAGISQAEACRRLGLSTKHMCQMLTGKAPITLAWAERILALCGRRIVITAPRQRSRKALR
jgi:hypothetical protein